MNRNWSEQKLGDVCEIVNGSTPLRSNKSFWENGEIPWFTIDDIRLQGRVIWETKQKVTHEAIEKTSLRLLPPNSILLCCTASVGEYGITKIPLTTNQQFNGLIIKNLKLLDPIFLYWFCATLRDQLLRLSGKTTIDFIPISRLKDIYIPIPPLPEQQRIVAILDQAFAAIATAKANAEKNLQNARELYETFLQEFLTNPTEKWDEKSLGEIFEIARGGSPRPISSYLTTSSDGINWIKIGDTKGITKYIYKTEEKIKPEGARRSRIVHEGDFILSNSMSFGKPYIMRTTGCIHDGWLVLSEKEKKIDKDFLYHVLGSNLIFQQFDSLAAGSTVRNLNIDLVKKVRIPLPNLQQQRIMVGKLEDFSSETTKLARIYNQKTVELEELKMSILQKAFNGELTEG